MSVSVGDLADWIMKHRKGDAFKGWTWDNAVDDILRSMDDKTLVYAVDANTGNIVGVCCGEVDYENKIYHAANILTTIPWAVAVMAQKFKSLYPNYKVRVRRKGKDRILKTQQTLERLIRKQIPHRN